MNKLLIVLSMPFSPNSGGVQMSTHKIASYFLDQGWQVDVFSFSKDGHRPLDERIRFHHASADRTSASAENLGQWRDLVEHVKPDCIINQTPYEHGIAGAIKDLHASLGFCFLACLRNSLFAVKLNIRDYQRSLLGPKLGRLAANPLGDALFQLVHRRKHATDLRRILDQHDRFVVFGEPNLEELAYFLGPDAARSCELVPNSIPSVLETAPEKRPVLLYVGRLTEYQKRAQWLLPLWEAVRPGLAAWEFHIIGDGPLRPSLERQARERGLDDVTLHGRCDPYPHYEKASMLVMLSSFEGFPNVLVEAQSRAVAPVIIDSYPIASWLIEDGVNGRILPRFDLDDMARAIVELGKSPEALARIQNQALESVRRFQIDQVGKQWLEVIERVSQEKRTPGTGA